MTTQTGGEDRYGRGAALLARLSGPGAGRPFAALDEVCPDLGRYLAEFVFGDIVSRPGLALARRQLVAVAALAALGTARPQLAFNITGALNVGCSAAEIVEVLLLVAVHAGFPAARNGLAVAHEVFAARADAAAPAAAARGGLEPAVEELVAIAIFAVRATAPLQLAEHARAAHAAGCTRDEIVEVLLQMAIYAGFPAAINALAVYRDAAAPL